MNAEKTAKHLQNRVRESVGPEAADDYYVGFTEADAATFVLLNKATSEAIPFKELHLESVLQQCHPKSKGSSSVLGK